MKPVALALAVTLTTAGVANAFVTLPMPPWTLEFPDEGTFPKPLPTGGK